MQILLHGVPTYLSSMPEQWFNPQTGRSAPVVRYDFHAGPSQRTSETFWAPCPLLGDTDTGMRGNHAVYLHNPENRPFDFCATGYIIPEDTFIAARFRASGPAAGAGVYKVEVDAARGYGWSEPTMLAGNPTGDGGLRFSLMLALGRHWFFDVPKGTRQFMVRVDLVDPNHALHVEIHAPDRIVQVLYAHGGPPSQVDVPVPEGLDGKV